MMKLASLLGLVLSVTSYAEQGGATTGNGGDTLRALFVDGRAEAAQKLKDIRWCSFASDADSETVQWILDRRVELMNDVLMSQHVWVTDLVPTCAFTQPISNADITLSFEACRDTQTIADAGRLLIHESVHHLGVTDETFADQVAELVYLAQASSSCGQVEVDPFDPASCKGDPMTADEAIDRIGLPESVRKQVGEFQVYSRSRKCYAKGKCSAWVRDGAGSGKQLHIRFDSTKYGRIDADGQPRDGMTSHLQIPASQSGKVEIALVKNNPRLELKTHLDQRAPWFLAEGISSQAIRSKPLDATEPYFGRPKGETISGKHKFIFVGDEYGKFGGVLTPSCLKLASQGASIAGDAHGNIIQTEHEVVIFSRFTY